MKSSLLYLLIRLAIGIFRVSCNNEEILLDLFSSSSIDNDPYHENQEIASINNNSTLSEPIDYNINSYNLNKSNNLSNQMNLNPNSTSISNLTKYQINDPPFIKTNGNLKLKKQKLFFGKKLLLWKLNTNRGYGAFLMLCGM